MPEQIYNALWQGRSIAYKNIIIENTVKAQKNIYYGKYKSIRIKKNGKSVKSNEVIKKLNIIRYNNFAKVRKSFINTHYRKNVIKNSKEVVSRPNLNVIDNMNRLDESLGNSVARQSIYRIVSSPNNIRRSVRTVKRVKANGKYTVQLGRNILSEKSLKKALSNSKRKIIKGKGVSKTLINESRILRDNEELGIEAIVRTKDAILATNTGRRLTTQGIKYTAKILKSSVVKSEKIIQIGKSIITKIMSNPATLKLSGITLAIICLIVIVSSSFSTAIGMFMGTKSGSEAITVSTEEQKAFISSLVPYAQENYAKYGVFPSITMAQAILESSWGKSGLATKGKNLFGVKADPSWTGKTIDMQTDEVVNGRTITIIASFRAYEKWGDSLLDHGKFLKENSRYTEAGVFKAKNYREQAYAIRLAGYATDPQYASLLCDLIEGCGLQMFDNMKKDRSD